MMSSVCHVFPFTKNDIEDCQRQSLLVESLETKCLQVLKSSLKNWIITKVRMRTDLLQLSVTSFLLPFTFRPCSNQFFSNKNFLKLFSIVDEGTGNLTNLCISHPPCPLYAKAVLHIFFFFHVHVAHSISTQSFYIKRNTTLIFNVLLKHCRKHMRRPNMTQHRKADSGSRGKAQYPRRIRKEGKGS